MAGVRIAALKALESGQKLYPELAEDIRAQGVETNPERLRVAMHQLRHKYQLVESPGSGVFKLTRKGGERLKVIKAKAAPS